VEKTKQQTRGKTKQQTRNPRGTGGLDDDDVDDVTIDRAMEFGMYLQEVSAVDAECRHLELRWRGEAAARALVNIAGAARAHDAAAAARLQRLEKNVAKVDAAAAAAVGLDTTFQCVLCSQSAFNWWQPVRWSM
jgi:hypothetical protein